MSADSAARDRERWDFNQEFVSQGAANVTAAFAGGFPVGGSFSRSALIRLAGGLRRAGRGLNRAGIFAKMLKSAGTRACSEEERQ